MNVALILHWVGLSQYISGIGSTSPSYITITDGILEISNISYTDKNSFILTQLLSGEFIVYVDDDDCEHKALVDDLKTLDKQIKQGYRNIGHGYAGDDADIANNCVDFPSFKKNCKGGMSIDMIEMINTIF